MTPMPCRPPSISFCSRTTFQLVVGSTSVCHVVPSKLAWRAYSRFVRALKPPTFQAPMRPDTLAAPRMWVARGELEKSEVSRLPAGLRPMRRL